MKINIFSAILTVFIVLTVFHSDSIAQPKGSMNGRVTDQATGDPMPGVNVILPGTYHGAATDLDGRFAIRGITAGEYTVRFQFIGYTTVVVTGVKITVGLSAKLDAALDQTVLAAGQEVVVIGKKPLFDIEETASRRAISADEIANSAVESTLDIVGNQVGIVQTDDEIHIRGGRSYENAYLLDGISIQDPLSGTGFGLQLSASAIEEIEIITGGFTAEFGQAMSGIINVKTKEGSNIFHGSISYETDDFGVYDKESATNFNTDIVDFSLDGPDPIFGVLFPKMGFDLKGTQTFFANIHMFISDSYTKIAADTLFSSTFNGRDFAPRQENNWSALIKYTWKITPKHKLQFSYNSSVGINQNKQSLQTTLENVIPGPGYPYRYQKNLGNFNTFTALSRQTNLAWTHTLGARTFYEVKFSNFYTNLRSEVDGKLWNEFTEPQDIVTFPVEYLERFGEPFTDENENGIYDLNEPFNDKNNNGKYDSLTDQDVLVFPGDGFFDFGNGDTWHDHWVDEWTLKADVTHKKDEHHDIKAGLTASYQEMQLFDIFNPWFGPLGLNNDFYRVYPILGAFYLQDKIVFEGLVANVGLRFDYWLPGEFVENAINDTNITTISQLTRDEFREDTFGLFGRRVKARISPRIGISHPISDKQVLFFNYGHFSKNPKPQQVYAKLSPTSANSTFQTFGNPNLNPETTVSYELGLKNRFSEDDVLTITAFYRDIFDYVTTVRFRGFGRDAKRSFITYLNLDYARSRGIEAEYRTRAGEHLTGSVNGTVSLATGKSSSPNDASLVARGDLPEKKITEDFLIWDRPWQFSINMNYYVGSDNSPNLFGLELPGNWNFNFRYSAQAGKRYTPIFDTGDTLTNGRTVYSGDLDGNGFADELFAETADYWAWGNLNFKKWFDIGGSELAFSVEVLNLFNRKNSNIINPVTGRAYELGDPTPNGWNDPLFPDVSAPVSPFPFNPARYRNQRNVKVGISFAW